MKNLELIALCTFGVESITANEIEKLGFKIIKKENGMVEFESDLQGIIKANLYLRTAERIVIKLSEFQAEDFDQLFDNTKRIAWDKYIPVNGIIHVDGKSKNSQLSHVPSCQSIVKKAIIEKMKSAYKTTIIPEDGPLYKVLISLDKNKALITLDTTGAGLHKRGYRAAAGLAPLKETLASSLIYLCRWFHQDVLIDPFCGSGTILIEAAMMALNIAPGVKREFVSETWPIFTGSDWNDARNEAKAGQKENNIQLFGYDRDPKMIKIARKNAALAGVEKYIQFKALSFDELPPVSEKALVITNPPYGERLEDKKYVEHLYGIMGGKYHQWKTTSFHVLTAYPEFQNAFGKRAAKNRKLYNGRIRCYFYQYFRKR